MSIEDACAKVEGLDIFNNPAAEWIFCKVAIDYSPEELRQDGIELLSVATKADLHAFSRLWLKGHEGVPTDTALIALSHAIRSNAHAIAQSKRES